MSNSLIPRKDPEPSRMLSDRRWKVTRAPGPLEEPYHAAHILDEVAGELGLLLWQRVRDVQLWSNLLPAGGGGLFHAEGGTPARERLERNPQWDREVRDALRVLEAVVTDGDRASPAEVAAACSSLSAWAERSLLFWTAAYYAEAAAAVRPRDPMLAIYAGRAARRQGAYQRGARWFHRAVGLARRSENWPAYSIAWLGLASQEMLLGRLDRAGLHLSRAWKCCKQYKIRSIGAETQHDMLVLAFRQKRFEKAEEHAKLALRLYDQSSPKVVNLAHDWAYLWVAQGYFSTALPVLHTVLPHIASPPARILALSSTAKATAALGEHRWYRWAREAVLQLAFSCSVHASTGLINLAEAAFTLGEHDEAHAFAMRGREYALARGELSTVEDADEVLQLLSTGAPVARDRAPPEASDAPRLAARLVAIIKTVAAPD